MTNQASAILKLLLLACLIALSNILAHWLVDLLNFEIRPSNEPMVHRLIVLSMVAYALLTAVPFVPGVEIGLTVLMLLGPKIAVLVYLCTLAALSLSFLIGRFIPERVLVRFLRDLRFDKASRLLADLEGLDGRQRLMLMLERAPGRFVPYLLRHRYLALLVAVNLPGNIVVGGGGGIALMAGLSRLFSPTAFLLTVAVAVAPVPLAWMILGQDIVGRLP